jgi:cytochrome c oxidase subunit 1
MIVFVGFNLTFFPQFILGYQGMPRRYASYPPEFQTLHVMSTAGASVLAVGYIIPLIYLTWAWKYGPVSPQNPWNAKGLEWEKSPTPPPTFNFDTQPIVTEPAYNYSGTGEEVEIG